MIDISRTDITRLYDLCSQIVELYRKQLRDLKINSSGRLSDSADFDIDFNEKSLAVYFITEGYAEFVENGRRPSTGKYGEWSSKYSDIENWLRQKIASGSFVPSGSHTIPTTERELKRVTGAIVNKITKFGYNGKQPMEKALNEAESLGILDEIESVVFDAFDREVDIEIEKIK